jgi:hypothetical protein
MTKARAPMGLKMGGKRLWNRITGEFDLAEHETTVLLQACRIVDVLDRLQVAIDSSEVLVVSPQGLKANPAVVEFRQQAVTLAKCMASLRIPIDSDSAEGRLPQQRVGIRRASLGADD